MEYLRMVEREDSGIDSDGDGQRRPADPVFLLEQSSDGTESDEDLYSNPEKVKQMLDAMAKHEEILRANDRFHYPFIDGPVDMQPDDDDDAGSTGTADRGTPLFEVELTASDEDDDDGSLIELVIPVLSKRYAKKKPWTSRFFESIFCCGRSSNK